MQNVNRGVFCVARSNFLLQQHVVNLGHNKLVTLAVEGDRLTDVVIKKVRPNYATGRKQNTPQPF